MQELGVRSIQLRSEQEQPTQRSDTGKQLQGVYGTMQHVELFDFRVVQLFH